MFNQFDAADGMGAAPARAWEKKRGEEFIELHCVVASVAQAASMRSVLAHVSIQRCVRRIHHCSWLASLRLLKRCRILRDALDNTVTIL